MRDEREVGGAKQKEKLRPMSERKDPPFPPSKQRRFEAAAGTLEPARYGVSSVMRSSVSEVR